MSWIFNNIRIYASRDDTKTAQVIARLQPLAGSTILHVFGNEAEIKSFGGLVATSGDLLSLQALTTTGLSYTLSGPEGILGDYFVKDFSAKRNSTVNICLFDRPSLPSNVPVYEVNLELYKDN